MIYQKLQTIVSVPSRAIGNRNVNIKQLVNCGHMDDNEANSRESIKFNDLTCCEQRLVTSACSAILLILGNHELSI